MTTIPLDKTGCPDLQQLVERAGRRHAAAIGEEYVEESAAPGRLPAHHTGKVGRIRPGDGGRASSEKAAAMTRTLLIAHAARAAGKFEGSSSDAAAEMD